MKLPNRLFSKNLAESPQGRSRFFNLGAITNRFRQSIRMMTHLERVAVFIFLLSAIILFSWRARTQFLSQAKSLPDFGGTYKEAVVGDLRFLDPVLAQSDTDKSVSKLLFSGLVKFNKNEVSPDLAEKWSFSSDGKTVSFSLRRGVVFHDGSPLTSRDVAYTIDQIKNTPDSAFNNALKDVQVETPDDRTVNLSLPVASGPFIYSCDFGIMPADLSLSEFNKKFIGTGPYQFVQTISNNNHISEIDLVSNRQYYVGRPYIDKIALDFFTDSAAAFSSFESLDHYGLFGSSDKTQTNWLDLSYSSSKKLGLILNLRDSRLADKETRRKILSGERFDQPIDLSLTTLDAGIQRQKTEEIKQSLTSQNINVTVQYLSPTDMADALSKKQYQLLLYGFDFGYDRDPYVFWHTSQLGQLNFAGYSDKASDIILEDARMIINPNDRNAKYDQFFQRLNGEYLVKYYDPLRYSFFVKNSLLGADPVFGYESSSRYDNINSWYLKVKYVKR